MTDVNIIEDIATELEQPLLSDAEREARKPDISRLPDAIGPDGKPLFRVGEKIVIERRAGVLNGNPYLDTRTYLVVRINDDNGNLELFDESTASSSLSNYIVGPKRGYVFKLAGRHAVSTKRKRGRPRKNPVGEETEVKAATLDANGQPIKKKRGRPPGSKNRDREVIKAEKKAKVAAKMARKAKIKARKALRRRG